MAKRPLTAKAKRRLGKAVSSSAPLKNRSGSLENAANSARTQYWANTAHAS